MNPAATASQTLGPFFNYALPLDGDLTGGGKADGMPVTLTGQVTDVNARPVRDALVEIWQANAAGRYRHPLDGDASRPLDPHFTGCGRTLTDADGRYRFATVKPGAVPFEGNRWQAPHILLAVFGAGLMRRMTTRIYFPGETMNGTDPILALVPEARRSLLVGAVRGDTLVFDIRLRGRDETPFFGN